MNVHNLLHPAGLWICIIKCCTCVQRPWHADTANKASIGSFHSDDTKYLHINNHHTPQNLHLKMKWNLLFHPSTLPCVMACTESHRTAGLSMTLPLCRSASNTKPNYCFLEGSGTWLMRQWRLSYVHTTWSMWVQTNMQELIPQVFLPIPVNWELAMAFSWANSTVHSLCKIRLLAWPLLSDHCNCSDNHGCSISTLQNEACGPISAICYSSVYCNSATEEDGQTLSTLMNVCYTLHSLSDELKVEATP
jgi:hypothetical protein